MSKPKIQWTVMVRSVSSEPWYDYREAYPEALVPPDWWDFSQESWARNIAVSLERKGFDAKIQEVQA